MTIRTAIVPGSDLEIAFVDQRVLIYNTRNTTTISMTSDEWSNLVEHARYLRSAATPDANKPGYWWAAGQ